MLHVSWPKLHILTQPSSDTTTDPIVDVQKILMPVFEKYGAHHFNQITQAENGGWSFKFDPKVNLRQFISDSLQHLLDSNVKLPGLDEIKAYELQDKEAVLTCETDFYLPIVLSHEDILEDDHRLSYLDVSPRVMLAFGSNFERYALQRGKQHDSLLETVHLARQGQKSATETLKSIDLDNAAPNQLDVVITSLKEMLDTNQDQAANQAACQIAQQLNLRTLLDELRLFGIPDETLNIALGRLIFLSENDAANDCAQRLCEQLQVLQGIIAQHAKAATQQLEQLPNELISEYMTQEYVQANPYLVSQLIACERDLAKFEPEVKHWEAIAHVDTQPLHLKLKAALAKIDAVEMSYTKVSASASQQKGEPADLKQALSKLEQQWQTASLILAAKRCYINDLSTLLTQIDKIVTSKNITQADRYMLQLVVIAANAMWDNPADPHALAQFRRLAEQVEGSPNNLALIIEGMLAVIGSFVVFVSVLTLLTAAPLLLASTAFTLGTITVSNAALAYTGVGIGLLMAASGGYFWNHGQREGLSLAIITAADHQNTEALPVFQV